MVRRILMVKGVIAITVVGAFGGMIIGALINPSTGVNQAEVLHQESVQNIQERTQLNLAEQKWIENNAKSMQQFNMTGKVMDKNGETVWDLTSGNQ
tara:strand:+ start:1661 stop:1948 length:288 start_codon:yes stop_codon:yes gene_type:complete